MIEQTYHTALGDIHYWTNEFLLSRPTLVFLPGLTADHRLFDKQVEAFEDLYNVLVWDAPGHGLSRPFELTFSLMDKARWLHEILETKGLFWARSEGLPTIIFVGQSMGGYVSQCYLQQYPDEVAGFISIDSATLKRKYMTSWEIWSLRHVEPVYRWYPWNLLLKHGAWGCAETEYGRQLMKTMMRDYSHEEYARLAGHGYRMLADAVDAYLPYDIPCPCLLLCGEKDMAGSTKRYNRAMKRGEGWPLVFVPHAGHNSNTDNPAFVNEQIASFLSVIVQKCTYDSY